MRIVNFQTFLTLPAGTIFQRYPTKLNEYNLDVGLEIKGDTISDQDFIYTSLMDQYTPKDDCNSYMETYVGSHDKMHQGIDCDLEFELSARDGVYDSDRLFAVWSTTDVLGLINILGKQIPEYVCNKD